MFLLFAAYMRHRIGELKIHILFPLMPMSLGMAVLIYVSELRGK